MSSESTSEPLSSLWYRFWDRHLRNNPSATSDVVLEGVIRTLRSVWKYNEDAVVYTMALRLDGGMIAQLTWDMDDPGFVNRASGATEGFYPRDYCGAAVRKRCNARTAVRTFASVEFLARDLTDTLAKRAQEFEDAFKAYLRTQLDE